MEAKSRLPEVTIVPAARPLAGDGTVDAAKAAAGKEPVSPGTPSSVAAGRSSCEERRMSVLQASRRFRQNEQEILAYVY